MFASNSMPRDVVMQRSNAASPARADALFVASDFCRRPGFGKHHPLSIPRVSAVLELCGRLGWLDEKHLRSSRIATVAELGSFHDPDYVAALHHVIPRHRVRSEHRASVIYSTLLIKGSLLISGATDRTTLHGGFHHGRRVRHQEHVHHRH